ncbi:MAG: hypothetical protein CMN04_07320 [Roseibacillus sp.]|nr:hypothetical protein [Roseibacillus sp.]
MNFRPIFLTCLITLSTLSSHARIRAGAAEQEITPRARLEIQHYFRKSIGVRDPLFARCLYLEDQLGNAVAIVGLDLIMASFETCDELRAEIREKCEVKHTLLNFSHTHASAALGPRGRSTVSNDEGSRWNDRTLDSIIAVVAEARKQAEPVSLRAGRSSVQVGFNRRLTNTGNGHVFMGVNRMGPAVPWVNVLVADSLRTSKPLAVLFEHAAHPVIVPHTSKLTSADFPGAAGKRIRDVLGSNVITVFGQGCGGNINGFPLRSTHEKAEEAGRRLGDASLKAIEDSRPIATSMLSVKSTTVTLPSAPLPDRELLAEMMDLEKNNGGRMKQLRRIQNLIKQGKQPPGRRFDAHAVMLGREWCLTTMPHEMFCQYELWIDKHAPFRNTMTFAFTNGYEGYVAVDEALALGARGGYEAGRLPNWGGQVYTRHLGPPAVGAEKIVKKALSSLWPSDLSPSE